MEWMTEPVSSLLQTLAWIGVLVGFAIVFRLKFAALIDAVVERVRKGAEIELPFAKLRGAPPELRSGQQDVVTSDGTAGSDTPDNIERILEEKQYPDGIVEDLYLVHTADVLSPRTATQHGWYRVRVWVEAYTDSLMADVERVTYRVYDDFRNRVVSTAATDKAFELWLNVYGEFTIIAYVERKEHAPAWLTRYIDLPGRPPE